MITIETKDRATIPLQQFTASIAPEKVNADIGRALANSIKAHFVGLPPNHQGFPSTHFWGKASDSTSFQSNASGGSVLVSGPAGVRLQLKGGTVLPGTRTPGVKYLTIPARAEAYGRRAREFAGLQILYGANGPVALIAGQGGAKLGKKTAKGSKEGLIMYWLAKASTISAHPDILPKDSELAATASKAANDYITRMARRTKGQS